VTQAGDAYTVAAPHFPPVESIAPIDSDPEPVTGARSFQEMPEAPMSLIHKVIEEHRAEMAARAASKAAAAVNTQVARDAFLSEFKTRVEATVRPLLDAFVADLIASRHDALVDDDLSNPYKPYISVRFSPAPGMKLADLASRESVFTLRAFAATRQVHHVSSYDQRSGEHGVIRETLGIDSVNPSRVERGFEEFLRAALKAWHA
jgi:hypothetical protein